MSSEFSDPWCGGRGGLKIRTFASFKIVFSRSSCARSAMPSRKNTRFAKQTAKQDSGVQGFVDGGSELHGVKGLVGGKFASSDCPVFCRGGVGLEVG